MTRLLNLARNLRKNQTDAESLLWHQLKNKQLEGLKFRRQQPLGKYIVDFVCFDRRVIVEVDGGHHSIQEDKDRTRDAWLIAEGFKVLRFWNNEVLQNIGGVIEVILENCLNHPPLTPPLKGGEK